MEKKPTAPAGTPVRLLYAYWPEAGKHNRVEAGTIIRLPLEQAKEMIKAGKAERADPLPGEE